MSCYQDIVSAPLVRPVVIATRIHRCGPWRQPTSTACCHPHRDCSSGHVMIGTTERLENGRQNGAFSVSNPRNRDIDFSKKCRLTKKKYDMPAKFDIGHEKTTFLLERWLFRGYVKLGEGHAWFLKMVRFSDGKTICRFVLGEGSQFLSQWCRPTKKLMRIQKRLETLLLSNIANRHRSGIVNTLQFGIICASKTSIGLMMNHLNV